MNVRRIALIGLGGVAASCVVLSPATASATWQSTHCNTSDARLTSAEKISQAASFAYTARQDGYQWGGGCWKDDNVDATPSDKQEIYSGGEGPDCSGFVFKTWRLDSSPSDGSTLKSDWKYWGQLYNVHGPFSAASYRTTHVAWKAESHSLVTKMDALASSGHVAMYWASSSNGGVQFIEAKGEAYGTNIWSEAYMGRSDFSPSARQAWLPECYPQCR
jgi:hypothetical protein